MRITKDLICEIINENHLYNSFGESMTKTTLWIISWICGVRSTMNSTDNRAIASALLLFAVTLLMEFGLNVIRKTHVISRLIDLVFCISGMAIIAFAVYCLVIDDDRFADYYRVMYIITICQMVFIVVDFMVLWVHKGPKSNKSDNTKTTGDSSKELPHPSNDNKSTQSDDIQKINNQHLLGGNLGGLDLSGGEKNE